MRVASSILLVLLLCALGGPPGSVPTLAPSPARADDFDDALDEFRAGMASEDWKFRRDAFLYLSGLDRPEVVAVILDSLRKETNGAVVLAGVEGLAALGTPAARSKLFEIARKGSGRPRLLVLLAMEAWKGPQVGEVLVEVAKGRDAPAAAQAALALATEKRADAVPVLLKLVEHADWQVRAAAARTLAVYEEPSALVPLSRALGKARGRDRADLIAALEAITGQTYGNDPAAWKKLADGTSPEEIRAQPKLAPSVFGVPIYGERVVLCLDNSLRMTDPHPFDGERLRALCDPPDGDPIPWFRVQTNAHFTHVHIKHLLRGLPKGTKFEMLVFNEVVRPVFGKLTHLGSSQRQILYDTMESLITDNGIATYPVLMQALDAGGARDIRAWKSGPDEIVFLTVNMPTAGEVTEADLVASAVALKARLRMVPIHTVGIHYHPYEMCRELAERTGGVYVNLTE